MNYKVYFINPPVKDPKIKMIREGRCMQRSGTWTAIWAPYSLCIAAAILEEQGIECKVSDCVVEEMNFSGLEKEILEFKPNAIIINTSTPSIWNDLSTASLAKKINKYILTVTIGIHPSEKVQECFDFEKNLDLIIRGEPEETFKELFNLISNKKNFSKVKGISYRKNDKIINNPQRPLMENLDWLPIPAWHLINLKYYTLPFVDKPFLLLGTARGCPHLCTFCYAKSYYGRGFRPRSPKKIVDEIEFIKNKFGVEEFLMWTEAFTINKKYCIEICDEIIKRNIKINFVCNSRVDSVDIELLEKLKQAGCWMIGYGVESGNQEIINKTKKGITLEQTRKAFAMTRKVGIETTAHTVIGLLDESPKTVKESFKFIKEIDPDFAQFYCAVPMPWTEIYEEANKKGYLISKNYEDYEQNISIMHTGKMTPQEVVKWRGWIYRRFYLRPITIWRTIKRIKNFHNLKKFTLMVKDFLTWV
jgi:radical SAM superfamily enzyme YgiQ (UPF0313 family)